MILPRANPIAGVWTECEQLRLPRASLAPTHSCYLVITPHLRGCLAPAHCLVHSGCELRDQRERRLCMPGRWWVRWSGWCGLQS